MRTILFLIILFSGFHARGQMILTNHTSYWAKSFESESYRYHGTFTGMNIFKINDRTLIWSDGTSSDTFHVDQVVRLKAHMMYFWTNCEDESYVFSVNDENTEVHVWKDDLQSGITYFDSYFLRIEDKKKPEEANRETDEAEQSGGMQIKRISKTY